MLRSASLRAAHDALQKPPQYGTLNAFIWEKEINLGQGALAAAQIPNRYQKIAVKDNIVTSQSSTTCGSGILRQHKSPFDATVVQTIREHGGSVAGKTNLDEFGMGSHSTTSFFGPVRRRPPYEQYSAGGSSGGSAVAVATSQCHVSLGTDTGGSVRLPAAYTGVVGFKPSYGIVSRWGVVPYANSMDTVGILGLTVGSVKQLAGIGRKNDPLDPTSVKARLRLQIKQKNVTENRNLQARNWQLMKPDNIKIGVPIEYNIEELDPSIREVWHRALHKLQSIGCTIVPVSLPNTKHALSAYYILAAAEASSNLSKYDGVRYGSRSEVKHGADEVLYSKTRGEFFGEEVKRRILLGSYTLCSEAVDNYFMQAQKVRRLVQRDFDRVFRLPNPLRPSEQFDISDMHESIGMDSKLGPAQVDFLICPTAPTLAPTLEDVSRQTPVDIYMNDVFTVPASLAGVPAISIPFEIAEEYKQSGIPPFAGIQVIGQYGDDDLVLNVGYLLERKSPLVRGLLPNVAEDGKTKVRDGKENIRKASPKLAKTYIRENGARLVEIPSIRTSRREIFSNPKPAPYLKFRRFVLTFETKPLPNPRIRRIAYIPKSEPLPNLRNRRIALKSKPKPLLKRRIRRIALTSKPKRLLNWRIRRSFRHVKPKPLPNLRIRRGVLTSEPVVTIRKHASSKGDRRDPRTMAEVDRIFDETLTRLVSLEGNKSERAIEGNIEDKSSFFIEHYKRKAGVLPLGDWRCGPVGCGYHNFERNTTCQRCGAIRPADV